MFPTQILRSGQTLYLFPTSRSSLLSVMYLVSFLLQMIKMYMSSPKWLGRKMKILWFCPLSQAECSSQHMVLHLMNIQTISLSKSSYPINLRRSTEKCKIQRSSNLLLKSLIRSAERLWFHQMQSVIVSNCLCNPHVFHVS